MTRYTVFSCDFASAANLHCCVRSYLSMHTVDLPFYFRSIISSTSFVRTAEHVIFEAVLLAHIVSSHQVAVIDQLYFIFV